MNRLKVSIYTSIWCVLHLVPGYLPCFGQLANEQTIRLTKPYQELSGLGRYLYDSSFYETARKQVEFDFLTFTYPSDAWEVEAFMCRPKSKTSKYPVIIYNRGGTGNFGKLTEESFPFLYELAREGFVVVGSNLRFVGKNGPNDELGGAELNDIKNLFELIKELPYVDANNVFMLGVSRGGLMTYQAISLLELNAAAVIGGVADSHAQYAYRPIFLEGWNDGSEEENYRGLKQVLPNFEEKATQYLDARSPVQWADRFKCPVLLLHSRQDGRVLPSQALMMAQALQKADKPYQLKIYDKKSHSLPSRNFDSTEETISWFKQYLKK